MGEDGGVIVQRNKNREGGEGIARGKGGRDLKELALLKLAKDKSATRGPKRRLTHTGKGDHVTELEANISRRRDDQSQRGAVPH